MGKTASTYSNPLDSEVHPHACGENIWYRGRCSGLFGPPPRVWGKLCFLFMVLISYRSTPTRVGKTEPEQRIIKPLTVHPHACGENRRRRAHSAMPIGPPPRVWGKLHNKLYARRHIRSTPTRVGKTNGRAKCRATTKVHPHACGENPKKVQCYATCVGPPPRVWGKLQRVVIFMRPLRSTPTRVGKTIHSAVSNSDPTVHPHACGENDAPSYSPSFHTVHPHACGENWASWDYCCPP